MAWHSLKLPLHSSYMRRALLSFTLLATWLIAPSCNAPTLPLPPPTALVSELSVDGTVTVSGDVLENAYVSCLNARLDLGVITRANASGRYELTIQAAAGDTLSIWQHIGTDTGPIVSRVVSDRGATDE
ncbi:MAG: hypothetical protein IPK60_25230 [Sandaracinaceae bacterium]|nr:hypothetical protein [Sandaracinaceae bacterium]